MHSENPSQVNKIFKNIDILIHCAATTSGAKDIVNKPYIHVNDSDYEFSYH